MRGGHIGGDLALVDLNVSDGSTSAEREEKKLRSHLQKSAIEGSGLSLRGTLYFSTTPDLTRFESDGHLNFYGLNVEGSVFLGDAILRTIEDYEALSLNNAHIKGGLLAYPVPRRQGQPPDKLFVTGSTSLLSAHIDSAVSLQGHVSSLNAGLMNVTGELSLDLQTKDTLNLTSANIQGSVFLSGSADKLTANLLKVTGDLYLSLQVKSTANLGGASINGKLDLSSFSFPDRYRSGRKEPYAFYLSDVDIGHSLALANSPSATDLRFRECWRSQVRCYPGYFVFAIHLQGGTASVLWKQGAILHVLDGTSGYLHDLNRTGALDLSTEQSIKDYVRFFGAHVWGDDGAFVVIESSDQLPQGSITSEIASELAKGLSVDRDLENSMEESDWETLATSVKSEYGQTHFEQNWKRYQDHFRRHGVRVPANIRYSNYLFRAVFLILTRRFPYSEAKGFFSRRLADFAERTRFTAQFKGRSSPYQPGYIAMGSDKDIAPLPTTGLPTYERPLIRGLHFNTGDYRSDVEPQKFEEAELSLRVPNWRTLLESRLARFQDASLDLTNTTCKTLQDADGRAWNPESLSGLKLENFAYKSIIAPTTSSISLSPFGKFVLFLHRKKDRIAVPYLAPNLNKFLFRATRSVMISDREQWLEKMPKTRFYPQPYAQLVQVLAETGEYEATKQVELLKTNHEVLEHYAAIRGRGLIHRPLALTYLLFWRLFRLCFGYGHTPWRASVTLAFCMFLGWAGTDVFNRAGYLVKSTSTAATHIYADSKGDFVPAYPRATANDVSPEFLCGSSINQLLYAADVFIPLLDLRQESRCDIRAPRTGEIYPVPLCTLKPFSVYPRRFLLSLRSKIFWAQLAKSLYAMLGWVVISGAILTYSGYLRRRAKE